MYDETALWPKVVTKLPEEMFFFISSLSVNEKTRSVLDRLLPRIDALFIVDVIFKLVPFMDIQRAPFPRHNMILQCKYSIYLFFTKKDSLRECMFYR